MYRMLFALPMFLLLAWWAGRGKPALTRARLVGVRALGFFGYYLASFLDFAGLRYVTASLERLVLYLNPTLVLLLSVLIYRRRVTLRQVSAMAVSYVGIALVFGHEMTLDQPDTGLGAALVLGSAVSYALYLVISSEEVKRIGSLRLTGLGVDRGLPAVHRAVPAAAAAVGGRRWRRRWCGCRCSTRWCARWRRS